MRLRRVKRQVWDVLAVCDDEGNCYVLDFFQSLTGNYATVARKMTALLKETVPAMGPNLGEPLSKSLGNGLFEFRKEPKGKRLRVIWFYDSGKVIVCTTAFTKAENTPRAEIDRALQFRDRYRRDKAGNRIRIDDPETSK